jgi:hypothetical protein
MTQTYFNAFQKINYNGSTSVNLTLRSKILENIKNDASFFYPYTIKDGQTADGLAYDYYGDSNYVWIIYLTNNIIDPYYEWPLNTIEFESFIIQKYGSRAEALSETVYYKKKPLDYYVNIYTNEYILASVYNPAVNGYQFTKVTIDEDIKINAYGTVDPAIWLAIDAYQYESDLNENKRYIKILDRSLLSSLEKQLKETMNG